MLQTPISCLKIHRVPLTKSSVPTRVMVHSHCPRTRSRMRQIQIPLTSTQNPSVSVQYEHFHTILCSSHFGTPTLGYLGYPMWKERLIMTSSHLADFSEKKRSIFHMEHLISWLYWFQRWAILSYLLLVSDGKSREILVSHTLSLQSSPPETWRVTDQGWPLKSPSQKEDERKTTNIRNFSLTQSLSVNEPYVEAKCYVCVYSHIPV